jgi:hypothetical protein
MFNRAISTVFIVAMLFVVYAPASTYGQREPRDRPDSVGSRAIGDKDGAQSRRDRKVVDPEAKVDEQLRSTSSTPNFSNLRRANIRAATVYSEATYADAIEEARHSYDTDFKRDLADKTFANSHVPIRLEDFARAYIIALNPIVKRKLGPYPLAVLRSMTTTYDGYEEILREKVPELDKKTIENLTDEAKKVVKALLSK